MKSKCYSLPIGPQHPAFPEAENLEVKIDGETVVDVTVNVGYLHRGIEKALQERNYVRDIYLAERVCGICNFVHTTAYCRLVEKLLGLEIPERAGYIRTIALELERLHSHLLWAGVAAYELGFDTLFQYLWRDRELVLDVIELISGKRVNYGLNTIGGVRRDVADSSVPKIKKLLDKLEKRAAYYTKVFTTDRAILARTKGIGILKRKDAERYCIVGPTARASGVRYDIRARDPYAAYNLVDWDVITDKGRDIQARVKVRVFEMLQSVRIIRQCLKQMPKGGVRVKAPFAVPENEAVSRVEAPRGELIYYGRSNGTDRPERIKIRTPTYANLLSIKPMLVGENLADLPIVVMSIDPCFSCTDRVALIDVNSGRREVLDEQEFRKKVEWLK
jgi:NADH-quinone oxidoreductase subunit D